jgi:DNA-binding CsgD family transcriptional regulator
MRRGRPPYPDVLTPREWEVLALLREGLTNKQIAARLGITERGAKYHVSEILSKLGLKEREEAVAWRGSPRWPAGLLAGFMARLSGTLPRIARGLLVTAVLALFALALGILVMDRRGGQSNTLADQQTDEKWRRELVRHAEEATAAARVVAPDGVLYGLFYAGGSRLYNLFFVGPGVSSDTLVVGPSNEPGTPRWEVSTHDIPVRSALPLPLDVKSLQKTPLKCCRRNGFSETRRVVLQHRYLRSQAARHGRTSLESDSARVQRAGAGQAKPHSV